MFASWFYLSIITLLGFGLQSFILKIAAEHKLNSRTIIFWFSLFTCCILWSYVIFVKKQFNPSSFVVLLGVVDAIAYYASSITRMEALKYLPGHLTFLILRSNIGLIYIYAAVVFEETITAAHMIAFCLLGLVAYCIIREKKYEQKKFLNYRLGITLITIATACSAFTHIITKYASATGAILEYMTVAGSFILLATVIENFFRAKEKLHLPSFKQFSIATLLTITNLTAWTASLHAMQIGPLSSISFIVGMSFIVPIVLSSIVHKELPSPLRVIAILLCILSIALFKS